MSFGALSGWAEPLQLLWLAPVTLLSLWLWRRQNRARQWLEANVSARFLHRWTRHSTRSLATHLAVLAVAGVLLVFAAARPYSTGEIAPEVEDRTIVLVIDASLSMAARDVPPVPASEEGEEPTRRTRLEYAADLASQLVHAKPDARFALISFSGAAVVHSPPTHDHLGLLSLLDAMRLHLSVPTSGTRFSTAFEAAAEIIAEREEAIDVVLLSDGELPEPDEVDAGLQLLELNEVPVHTVAVGGTEAVAMRLFDLESVLAPGERQELGTYQTRRIDDELSRIAERTRAVFVVPQEGDELSGIVQALSPAARVRGVGEQGRADRAVWFVVAFGLLLLYELLWLADRTKRRWIDGARRPARADDWLAWRAQHEPRSSSERANRRHPLLRGRTASGIGMALAPFLLLSECPEPLGSAWRVIGSAALNEVGRAHAEEERHVAAKLAFRRAAKLGWHREVSWTNLGSVQLAAAELESAHATFERVLRQAPGHRAALYNDGWALYRWGAQELDEEACETERTRVLWQQARQRFANAGRPAWWLTEAHRLARAARRNESAFDAHLQRLDEIDERCSTPPPPESSPEAPPDETPPPEQDPPSEGEPEGDGGGGDGGGEGDQNDNDGNGGEPPPGAPPPLSAQEQQEIAAALERIRADASAAGGFHQTGESQLNPDNARQGRGLQRKW